MKGHPQASHVWEKLKCWVDNVNKNYVPKKASFFCKSYLEKWTTDSKEETPVKLQKKCLAIIAFTGGLRSQEDYDLTWEDVTIKEATHEILVKVPKTKGNMQGRAFIITDTLYYRLIVEYKRTFVLPVTGFFYRAWNIRYKEWNVTRRGIKFFQQVPKEIAETLGLKNPETYTHHAFRRTLASSLHEAGATPQMIKRADGWRSDRVVEGDSAESVGEKWKCAQLLMSNASVTCDCGTVSKKGRGVNLNGTFNNCTFNIKN